MIQTILSENENRPCLFWLPYNSWSGTCILFFHQVIHISHWKGFVKFELSHYKNNIEMPIHNIISLKPILVLQFDHTSLFLWWSRTYHVLLAHIVNQKPLIGFFNFEMLLNLKFIQNISQKIFLLSLKWIWIFSLP